MLHACIERFDVMGGRENILGWDGEVNKAWVSMISLWQVAWKTCPMIPSLGLLSIQSNCMYSDESGICSITAQMAAHNHFSFEVCWCCFGLIPLTRLL
jgi:hypothetical protein